MKPRGLNNGVSVNPITQWQEFMTASGMSPATVAVRTRIIRALMSHSGIDDPLRLTRLHVVSFLARGLSPWSKITYWKSITKWSEFLREFDYDATSSLTKGIARPRTPDPVARPLTDETVSRLLSAHLSPRASAYVRLALYAGLRVHEIAKIRGEDFDFAAGWLMVAGKGGSIAPVPIHPELARLAENMPEFGYWFTSPACPTRCVYPTAVSGTIIAALRTVGSTATAHQLRDTAATRMQRQVKDIRITQTMLRHRSIRSTQKYAGVSDESMHAAVLSLDWGAAAVRGVAA